MRSAAAAVLLAFAPCALRAQAGGPPGAPSAGTMVNLSLVEALTAVDRAELAGVFLYVSEVDAPHAFAGFLIRDKKALKRYAGKLESDLEAAGGLTAWDHEVCAMLVNLFAGAMGPAPERPDRKRLKAINECVLAPVLTQQDVAARRKR